MKNEKLLKQLAEERNLNPITVRDYKHAINRYTGFFNQSLTSLLAEAEEEEEKGIRWKNRRLKTRLLKYRRYLVEKYQTRTIRTQFTKILTIYRHFEIELHQLPPLNLKRLNNPVPVNYDDLPTKSIIQEVLKVSNPLLTAVILFGVSSGSTRKETLSLTIHDFIEATKDYHGESDILEVLEALKNEKMVVPTWKMKRHKTNKYYVTFNSPEATNSIITYLQASNRRLNDDEPLFKINKDYLCREFKRLNDLIGLGRKGNYCRFRSHMLRKFHASQLYNSGLSIEEVDALQGRGKDHTHTSYFMEDPSRLKEKYLEHLPSITIKEKVKPVTVKSGQYQELEEELNRKNKELHEIETRLEVLEEILTDSTYKELIRKI